MRQGRPLAAVIVARIHELLDDGVPRRVIAARLGISVSSVDKIAASRRKRAGR